MNTIIPAILAETPESFVEMQRALAPCGVPLHIDLADGHFVPNRTISLAELRKNEPDQYTLHLMFELPEKTLQELSSLKAQRIIIHAEATHNLRAVVNAMRAQGKKIGVALNPETPISAIAGIVDMCDTVLFMSVTPGFQGGAFLPSVCDKIQAFRSQFPHVSTSIDGGVNETTLRLIAGLGLDTIVVGSAIVRAKDPVHAFRVLQERARVHA